MHQELTQSRTTGGIDASYGSAPDDSPKASYGSASLSVEKESRCNSNFCFKWIPLLLSIAALAISIVVLTRVNDVSSTSDNALETAESSQASIAILSRNGILSQFAFEQRIRSEGGSGVTNVRQHTDGDDAFDEGTFSNGAVSAIHDHANFINVAGMGEIEAVLNGVEFQTRHNDYNLEMPHTTSDEYGATEQIPMPDVPPEVLQYENITDQIEEMQEWFRAFKEQNKSHRYYPDYFKPILCYLEGTWLIDEGILDEPFDSDRHSINATTWNELHDKIRYMVNSGRKQVDENLAHLPSAIRNLIDETWPVASNWEYRIACVPLKNDVPTARFRVADDISVQLFGGPLSREELFYNRRSRFEISKYINETDPDSDESYPNGYWAYRGVKYWNYLDYLMEQVPGKDNFQGNLTDILPNNQAQTLYYTDLSDMNAAYYSRYFALSTVDAMGGVRHRRSYSDRYLWAAMTSQGGVSPVSMIFDGEYVESRWSYAIPLEIIYTTPIVNWNPYNVSYIDMNTWFEMFLSGEWPSGSCLNDGDDAFPGWSDFNSYYTPADFFEDMAETTNADTAQSDRCVLGSDGESYPVHASGHWITFPSIGGDVGYVRQRYPIPPIHTLGHAALKEIKALQALILDDEYDDGEQYEIFGDDRDRIYGFDINLVGGDHQHIMHIAGWKVSTYWYDDENESWLNGSDYRIIADSDIANAHEHTVELWRYRETETNDWHYVLERCRYGIEEEDSDTWLDDRCDDGHVALTRGFA